MSRSSLVFCAATFMRRETRFRRALAIRGGCLTASERRVLRRRGEADWANAEVLGYVGR